MSDTGSDTRVIYRSCDSETSYRNINQAETNSKPQEEIKQTNRDSRSSPSDFSTDVTIPVLEPASYIRAINKRGNVYMVVEPKSFDPIDQMIKDLYNETREMSLDAEKKAGRYKVLGGVVNILIVIFGTMIGVLALNDTDTTSKYVASILGFTITATKTLVSMFSLEKRGILLKSASSNLRKISRQVKNLENSNMKPKDKKRKLEEYYTEVDEIDMIMFDNNATTIPRYEDDKASSSNSSDTKRKTIINRRSRKERDQVIIQMNEMNTEN